MRLREIKFKLFCWWSAAINILGGAKKWVENKLNPIAPPKIPEYFRPFEDMKL